MEKIKLIKEEGVCRYIDGNAVSIISGFMIYLKVKEADDL